MPDPAEVAWQRARTMAETLILTLDELDDARGLRRLAASWKPSGQEKAKVLLSEARKALDGAERAECCEAVGSQPDELVRFMAVRSVSKSTGLTR
jgi:hypothetical protein